MVVIQEIEASSTNRGDGGLIPDSPCLYVQMSLGKILNPKLLLTGKVLSADHFLLATYLALCYFTYFSSTHNWGLAGTLIDPNVNVTMLEEQNSDA